MPFESRSLPVTNTTVNAQQKQAPSAAVIGGTWGLSFGVHGQKADKKKISELVSRRIQIPPALSENRTYVIVPGRSKLGNSSNGLGGSSKWPYPIDGDT
jgi:hypothetical protein